MNAFFPVGSVTISAISTASAATAIPSGGPMIRLTRDTSAEQVWIKFGTGSVVATTDSMELISGVVEELENPNSTIYTHFSLITLSGICKVNVSTGPRYKVG